MTSVKSDKVIVFKKKRRKGYIVKNGHRQYLTKLEILKIDEKACFGLRLGVNIGVCF